MATTKTQMSCRAFADLLDNTYFFDDVVDGAFWNKSFKSETFFEAMKAEAERRDISLSDSEEWDYENYFWNLYQCSEKGLS